MKVRLSGDSLSVKLLKLRCWKFCKSYRIVLWILLLKMFVVVLICSKIL